MLEHSLNLAWVLLCAFLVMFMQLGFAMVETGFTRSKNAVHTMAMNFVVYAIGIVGFWLVGYGIAMGGVEGWRSLGPAGWATTSSSGSAWALASSVSSGARSSGS